MNLMTTRILLAATLLGLWALPALAQQPAKCQLVKIAEWPVKIINNHPILEGSIGLASRLGMTSVAEGVETEDDWELMREVGCDVAQGWFIGRPMPAEAVSDWLAQWRPRQQALRQA